MKKNEILVVQIKPEASGKIDPHLLRNYILEQKEEGVIIIPSWCEVIIAPSDVKIKVKGGKER